MIKKAALSSFVLAVITLVLSIFYDNRNNKIDTITIAIAEQPVMALLFIAEENGYFKELGLTVKYRKYILGRDALEDVINNKADLATVYDIPVIRKIYEGADIGILTSLHRSTRNHAIVVRKSDGISSIKDLRGKRVAVTLGISTDFFLYSALENEGMLTQDITVIDTRPEDLLSEFKSGNVDAAVLFNPYLNNAQRIAMDDLTFLYSEAYQDESLLVGKKNYMKQNRDKILKVLQALKKAENFAKTNKQASILIVDKYLTAYDEEAAADTWDDITLLLGLDNLLVATLDREIRFIRSLGIYKNEMPSIREHLQVEYLRQVYPDAVTLY